MQICFQVNECDLISQRIGEVISLGKENDQNISSFEIIPDGFFEDMESSWKGRVKRIHAEEEFVQVDQAAEALCLAVCFRPSLIFLIFLNLCLFYAFALNWSDQCSNRDIQPVFQSKIKYRVWSTYICLP